MQDNEDVSALMEYVSADAKATGVHRFKAGGGRGLPLMVTNSLLSLRPFYHCDWYTRLKEADAVRR